MERTTPPPPGAGLNGSPLVGLLAQLGLADRPAAPAAFVEGMGRWLGWREAIPLSAVLQAPPPAAPAAARKPPGAAALEGELQRVRSQLTQAIEDDRAVAAEDGHSFVPFRRRCFALQQAMDAAVGPLRTQLRAAVARQSATSAHLAALDAVLATALAPREQAQLALMPALLEKHFNRLRPAQPGTDTDWLARFRQDMRRLLLAELDLRLQPVLGLLATLQPHGAKPEPETP